MSELTEILAAKLGKVLEEYPGKINQVPGESWSIKKSPGKWSKKEILGHLIDSAQNNLRRFVVGQYEQEPTLVYRQDDWVTSISYQQWSPEDLLYLWILVNRQIQFVLQNLSDEQAQRTVRTNLPEAKSILWLSEDYLKHMFHHLHQILDLPDVTYP